MRSCTSMYQHVSGIMLLPPTNLLAGTTGIQYVACCCILRACSTGIHYILVLKLQRLRNMYSNSSYLSALNSYPNMYRY